MRRVGILTFLVLTMALPRPVPACLNEYRTVEWMAGASQLVIVGRIEKVVRDGTAAEKENETDPDPAVATVRVVRVLHGQCDASTLDFRNGPVPS